MPSSALAGVNNRVSASEPTGRVHGSEQSLSDEALLRLCAEGQNSALEELVRRYQTPLHRFLYRLMGSSEDAEDGVVEVFVRAWQHASRFQYRARVATWLYRIAVNIARDAHSRRKSQPEEVWPEAHRLPQSAIGNAEDDALRLLEREDQSRALQRALERLSPGDRLLLVLYYLEERDYSEIQAITGLSYTVLKTRLARARRRLREWLDVATREKRA